MRSRLLLASAVVALAMLVPMVMPSASTGTGTDGFIATAAAAAAAATAAGCGTVALTACSGGSCAATIAGHIAACSASGGGIVLLEPGTYHLNDPDVGEMAPMLPLNNVAAVTLQGATHPNGTVATTLMIHGLRWGFSVAQSTNIVFRNFAMDMARQPYTYGKCVAVTSDSFTIEYDPGMYPFTAPVAPEVLTTGQSVRVTTAANATVTSATSAPTPAYLLRVQATLEFDPTTWRAAIDAVDIYDDLQAVSHGAIAYSILFNPIQFGSHCHIAVPRVLIPAISVRANRIPCRATVQFAFPNCTRHILQQCTQPMCLQLIARPVGRWSILPPVHTLLRA